MKSGIIIVFIAVAAFAFAIPAIEDAKGGSDYFKKKLHEIQGAIDDTINAGKDLEDMEERLQDIVNLSSYFFRTESASEYAVDADAYANDWTPAVCEDDDAALFKASRAGLFSCAELAAENLGYKNDKEVVLNESGPCASDNPWGKLCRKSCETCDQEN